MATELFTTFSWKLCKKADFTAGCQNVLSLLASLYETLKSFLRKFHPVTFFLYIIRVWGFLKPLLRCFWYKPIADLKSPVITADCCATSQSSKAKQINTAGLWGHTAPTCLPNRNTFSLELHKICNYWPAEAFERIPIHFLHLTKNLQEFTDHLHPLPPSGSTLSRLVLIVLKCHIWRINIFMGPHTWSLWGTFSADSWAVSCLSWGSDSASSQWWSLPLSPPSTSPLTTSTTGTWSIVPPVTTGEEIPPHHLLCSSLLPLSHARALVLPT